MQNQIIDLSKQLCDTMIRRFPNAKDLPPKHLFHYHQGVFLSGMLKTWSLCKDETYFHYAKAWVDSLIHPDGTIDRYDSTRLDDIQPGILLFPLYRVTGDPRYKKALETLIGLLKNWKKNGFGGFWHKDCHPDQMWLDSLYMAGPIQAEYAAFSGESVFLDEAARQALIMYAHMVKKENGLMYHAWDASKKEDWADKESGLSPMVWGRAQGWYVVAILDILEFMSPDHPDYAPLLEIERTLLTNIMKYRDEKTKMWYQVPDEGTRPGNWIETSCSCLFTAALAKAIRMGIMNKCHTAYVGECCKALCDSLKRKDGDVVVDNVCIGTGVCDYQGYIERPTCENDLHGVGAFLLMSTETARLIGAAK